LGSKKGSGGPPIPAEKSGADVLISATANPRSNILALAVVGFALAPQNGAKLFVYLFIYFGTSGNIHCKKEGAE
jgi:hypothetical protein